VPRFAFDAKAHLIDLFAGEPVVTDESGSNSGGAPSPDSLLLFPIDGGASGRAAVQPIARPWNLLEERCLDPTRPAKRGYRRTSDFWVSTTDPDATPMWTAGKVR
jgi:hypothetical protein